MPRKVQKLAVWVDATTVFSSDELNAMLEEWCKGLSEREREVLMMRYGILGGERRTITEAALRYKVAESRITQIHKSALRKLRRLAAKTARGPFLFSDA